MTAPTPLDLTRRGTRPGAQSHFLTGIARTLTALGGTPAFGAAVQQAHQQVVGGSGERGRSGRAERGNEFESALANQLNVATQAHLAAQTVAALGGGHIPGMVGPLLSATWLYVGHGHASAPADFVLTLTFGARTRTEYVEIPVNVKYAGLRSDRTANDACSVATLLRTAMGRPLTDTTRVNVNRTLLEWHAGRRRIHKADYQLLCVTHDSETLTGWHFQGLLSAATDGQLALRRNTKREGVLYRPADGLIPPALDVNDNLAQALSPRPDPDAFALALTGFLTDQLHLSAQQRSDLADRLLDTHPADLAAGLHAALTDQGHPAAPGPRPHDAVAA